METEKKCMLIGQPDGRLDLADAPLQTALPMSGIEKGIENDKRDLDPDLWGSVGMVCDTCVFYVPKKPSGTPSGTSPHLYKTLGRCRRHAPTMSGYPAVFPVDWCGDHKLDENKTWSSR